MSPVQSACTIDVVCMACEGRDLLVLLRGSARDAGHVPTAPWRGTGSLDDAARALVASAIGAAAWCEQVGAVAAKGSRASVSIVFVALAAEATAPKAGAMWRRVADALPRVSARERGAIRAALAHLRSRIEQSPVAFRLLPPVFTLAALQDVYETVLGRTLHKASFRRALDAANLVQPTDEWRSEGRGRPAQLYKFAAKRRRTAPRAIRFDLP